MANFLDSTPLSGFFYNPKKDNQAAMAGLNQGTQAYNDLVPPSYETVDYTGPQEAQDIRLDPAALERVGPTAMGDVSVDPQYKDQQLAQLAAPDPEPYQLSAYLAEIGGWLLPGWR